MADMMNLDNPILCTWCKKALREEKSAVCKECGRLLKATLAMDPESAIDRYPVDLFKILSDRKFELRKEGENGPSGA
jgi:hypothetical protein